MAAEVADEREVLAEAALVEHPVGVAADGEHPTGFEGVVLIEIPAIGRLRDRAPIDHLSLIHI